MEDVMTPEQIIEKISQPLSEKYQYTCKVRDSRVVVTNHKGQEAGTVWDDGTIQIEKKYKGRQVLMGSLVVTLIRTTLEA